MNYDYEYKKLYVILMTFDLKGFINQSIRYYKQTIRYYKQNDKTINICRVYYSYSFILQFPRPE